MPRGRPKGSKNAKSLKSLSHSMMNEHDSVLKDAFIDDEEFKQKNKIFKKCVQESIDEHWVEFSEKSANLIEEVANILVKKMDDNFNIKLKQTRKRRK